MEISTTPATEEKTIEVPTTVFIEKAGFTTPEVKSWLISTEIYFL